MASLGFACAQSINQSVEVSNNYLVNFEDFQKQNVNPTIADSLYKFDYSFDYSVFETPYRGSYEFSPYEVQLVPETLPYDGRKLYLRAGAGMALYPELDFVYNALSKDNLVLSIYNRGRGHYGHFEALDNSPAAWSGFKGYYFNEELGASGRLYLPKNKLDFNASYTGIFASTAPESYLQKRSLHSAYLRAVYAPLYGAGKYLDYKVDLSYRLYGSRMYGKAGHEVTLQGFLAPVLDDVWDLAIDYDMRYVLDNFFAKYTPHLGFNYKSFAIDAGVRMDYFTNFEYSPSFSIAPAVNVSYNIIDEKLLAFAGADGGQFMVSPYSIWSYYPMYHLTENSSLYGICAQEPLHLFLGVKGSAFTHLQYELRGGGRLLRNVFMESSRTLSLSGLNVAYVDADIRWDSSRLDVDGKLSLNFTDAMDFASCYLPALLRADVSATYNWLERVYAGVDIEISSARKHSQAEFGKVPGYVDFGLRGEYKLNTNWALWAKSGNLLGMRIERHPGFVEKWPHFTFGVCLSL